MPIMLPTFKGEILVFEDDCTNQQLIKSVLLKAGFDVAIANDGKEGVDIISNRIQNGVKLFDLIFLDIYMPEMDGLETAKALLSLGVKMPVVVTTSHVTLSDREKFNAYGLSDILEKPFSIDEMYACLGKYFTPVGFENTSQSELMEREEERRIKLHSKFVKNNLTTFRDISTAIEAGDIKLAHRLTHSLCGLAGLMGKTLLQQVSRNIENMLAKGNADGVADQLPMLEHALNRVLDDLSPLLDTPETPTADSKPFDKAEALAVFGTLERFLQADSAECLQLTDSLKAIPGTASLIVQIENYEFEQALRTLSSFKQSLGEFTSVETAGIKKRRILVADDEAINIDELCHILMPQYDVIVAKSGKATLQKANKHKPDIILLDVIMPDVLGFEVITELKNSDITRKIPVIFITGLNNDDDEEKGLMLGAVDYIVKPFHAPIVKARVHTHMQNVEYINTIERLCMVDALTNLPNRRSFDSRMRMEWERAAREKYIISLLMIDVDHFKNYNDTYGHQQGDVLLKAISSLFTKALFRPADFVSRWGGEEFVIILPNTALDGAMHVAERIRQGIEDACVPCNDGTMTNVTVSIGVYAEVPLNNDGKSIDDFVTKADKALYKAKNTGRNRVQSII